MSKGLNPSRRLLVVLGIILLFGGLAGLVQVFSPNSTDPQPPASPSPESSTLNLLTYMPMYPETNIITVDGQTRDDVSFDLMIYTDGQQVFAQISGVFPQNTSGNICFTPVQDIPVAERGAEGIVFSSERLYCFLGNALIPLNAE